MTQGKLVGTRTRQKRNRSLRGPRGDAATVRPPLFPFITIYMAPIRFVFTFGCSGVQMPFVHRHRVTYIVASRIRMAAILPFRASSIVDSKVDVPVGALRLISAVRCDSVGRSLWLAGHEPQLTHPHLVGPAILDFLTRADERLGR